MVSVTPQKLLPTILSRTQEIAVPLIGESELAGYAATVLGKGPDEVKAAIRLAGGNILELKKIFSDEYGENVRENFEYFAELMRYSYNDRHLELINWAENMASMGRENQKRYLEYSTGMLRESYMISAGLENISYLWGGEAEFCSKFAPFIGNHNIEQLVAENQAALRDITQNGNAKIVFTHYALSVSKLIVKV